MYRGGYQLIDFKGTALTSGTEATIPGVYSAIESTNKQTVVTGMVVGGTEYDDFPVLFTVDSTDFVGIVHTAADSYITIEVASDDGVTVTVVTEA